MTQTPGNIWRTKQQEHAVKVLGRGRREMRVWSGWAAIHRKGLVRGGKSSAHALGENADRTYQENSKSWGRLPLAFKLPILSYPSIYPTGPCWALWENTMFSRHWNPPVNKTPFHSSSTVQWRWVKLSEGPKGWWVSPGCYTSDLKARIYESPKPQKIPLRDKV